MFHIWLSSWKNNYWHSVIQLPILWNHYCLSVQGSLSNTKTTSRRYFDKWVILKWDLRVACLWIATLAISEFRSASLVICEQCATIQQVCELLAVSSETYSESIRKSKMKVFAKIINKRLSVANYYRRKLCNRCSTGFWIPLSSQSSVCSLRRISLDYIESASSV